MNEINIIKTKKFVRQSYSKNSIKKLNLELRKCWEFGVNNNEEDLKKVHEIIKLLIQEIRGKQNHLSIFEICKSIAYNNRDLGSISPERIMEIYCIEDIYEYYSKFFCR